jgi:hypothetical protein
VTAEYRVVPYEEPLRSAWETLVLHAQNGCLFHRRRFLDYHPLGRFTDASLLFYKGNRLLAILPGAQLHDGFGKEFRSHPGASWGGFVFANRPRIAHTTALIQTFCGYLHTNDFSRATLTLPPFCYWDLPDTSLEFALQRAGFTRRREELTSIVPINSATITPITRTAAFARGARKAQKMGVCADQLDSVDALRHFHSILSRRLSTQYNVVPTHTLDELLHLRDLFPHDIRLFAASHDSSILAGVLCFEARHNVSLAFYISHTPLAQRYRPLNLIFTHMYQHYASRGFNFIDLGLCSDNMSPNFGLARFKEESGAFHSFRTTWSIEL